jgi:predicted GNAT family N-acyltransferase
MNVVTLIAVNPEHLIDHFALRRMIFIEEQGVDETLELDGQDNFATLIVMYVDDLAVGCARYRILDDAVKVERVGILREYRRRGLGEHIMAFVEVQIHEYTKAKWITLNAQLTAKDFYLHLGYAPIGPIFVEANIEHQKMMKEITQR